MSRNLGLLKDMCSVCGRFIAVRQDGLIGRHGRSLAVPVNCPGYLRPPNIPTSTASICGSSSWESPDEPAGQGPQELD